MESTPAYPRAEGLKTLMEIRDVLCGKRPSERCIIPLDYDRDLKPYMEGFSVAALHTYTQAARCRMSWSR